MKIRRTIYLATVFFMLSFLASSFLQAEAAAPDEGKRLELTLEEAIGLGMANSSTIKARVLAVSKARADVQAARSGYFPSLSTTAAWTHYFETFEPNYGVYTRATDPVTVSVDLGQSIFTFGKIRNGVRLAEEGLKSAGLSVAEEMRSLSIQIQRAFYGYLLAEEVVRINDETLAAKEEALEVARKKYAAGISSDFEVLQAEADVESFKPTVISARNQVKIILLTVKNLLGLDEEEDTKIIPVGALEHEPLDFQKEELVRTTLVNKYDLKSFAGKQRLAEIQKQVTQSSRLPTISGFLNYSLTSGVDSATGANRYWGTDAWDGTLSGGISVQIPVSSFIPWSKESANLRKSDLELEELRLGYESLVSGIKVSIESILLKLEEEKLKIASGKKGMELAQRLYDSAREQYARGVISSIDLKDAQLGLNSSQLAHIQTIYNYKKAVNDLMDAVGVDHF